MKQLLCKMFSTDIPHFRRRFVIMIGGLLTLSCALSLLICIDKGTDPLSCFNLGVSAHLPVSFGTWQLLFNLMTLLFVFSRDPGLLGYGTVANMVLVGYASDFFRYIWSRVLPPDFFGNEFVCYLLLLPVLFFFVVGVALYVAADLGTSAYDAVPFLIARAQPKRSFWTVRVLWDILFILLGWMLGSTVGLATVITAFLLGPAIALFKEWIQKWIS